MRAFVVRPFGVKQGVDFEKVHAELLKPALAAARIEGDTTLESIEQGDIREDMFRLLVGADLVIADVSTNAPNVVGKAFAAGGASTADGVVPRQGLLRHRARLARHLEQGLDTRLSVRPGRHPVSAPSSLGACRRTPARPRDGGVRYRLA